MNRVGLRTLFLKEVRRFSKVWGQTVLSPLITNSLYFLVFGAALGSRLRDVGGVPYIEYVVPGLIMLSMIRNSFLNTSSSLFQSKVNGTVIDILVAPLGVREILLAYVSAAVLRAVIVGCLVYGVARAFTDIGAAHPLWTFTYGAGVATAFALFGIVVALWAEKYDHLAVFPNFILTPLIFLGGVFYSITMLPAPWDLVSRLNPVLYLVNGMRYGLIGASDVAPWEAAAVLVVTLGVAGALSTALLARGYNLRA